VGFAGLAVAWYVLSTFIPLGLPNVAVVLVFGLLLVVQLVEHLQRAEGRGFARTSVRPAVAAWCPAAGAAAARCSTVNSTRPGNTKINYAGAKKSESQDTR
jgi:hypothetical protein